MDATATSSATSAYGSASTGSGSSPGGTDFNTFLRMLTVQMQNQDGAEPHRFHRLRGAACHFLGGRTADENQSAA